MTTLFITEEKLKSFTSIDENVDPAQLYPFVLQAQDFWIQQNCGTLLYNTLKNMVTEFVLNDTPIPTDYKTLLDDYIAPTVVHFAYYQALPMLKYRTTNKGVLSGTSEVAQGITLDELQYVRNTIFDTAKFYNERLSDYLQAFPNLFPEYQTYTYQDGMAPQRGTSYYTGLVIPRKYNNNFDDCNLSNGACNTPLN